MSFYRLLLCSMPLLLTACGDGWEAQRTTEIFPYGNQRTAGSGVVYVRAKMMPEKELVVEAPAPTSTPEPAPAPVLSGDKIFNEAQMKGAHASAPVKASSEPVPAHAAVEKPDQVVVAAPPAEQAPAAAASVAVVPSAGAIPAAPAPTPGAAAVATPVPPPPAAAVTPAAPAAVKEEIKKEIKEEIHGSAADVISAPKQDKIRSKMAGTSFNLNSGTVQGQGHPQEQEVAVSTLRDAPSESDAKKAAAVMPAAGDAYEVYPNEVVAPTHSISMPKNEIVSPKKDYVHGTGEGRRSLDQIYEDSF